VPSTVRARFDSADAFFHATQRDEINGCTETVLARKLRLLERYLATKRGFESKALSCRDVVQNPTLKFNVDRPNPRALP
jgi:hypothetical protein